MPDVPREAGLGGVIPFPSIVWLLRAVSLNLALFAPGGTYANPTPEEIVAIRCLPLVAMLAERRQRLEEILAGRGPAPQLAEADLQKLQAILDVPLETAPAFRLSHLKPELAVGLERVRQGFLKAPHKVLEHIIEGTTYQDWTSTSHKLDGGMHTPRGRKAVFEKHVADQGGWERVRKSELWKQSQRPIREFIKEHVKTPQQSAKEIQELEKRMAVLGITDDTPEERFFYHLVHHKSISGPLIEDNGVVRYVFEKEFFKGKRWKDSQKGAEVGRAPVGAKTLFPASWDEAKIVQAVDSILMSPDTRLLSLSSENGTLLKQVMLEGTYDGVVISVAIAGGNVNSAYPSWIQDRKQTVGRLKETAAQSWNRIDDLMWDFREHKRLPRISQTDAIAIYLGDRPATLNDADYAAYRAYFDPSEFKRDSEPGLAFNFRSVIQSEIARYLTSTRQLEDIKAPLTWATSPPSATVLQK